jgi:hypothetical protein
LPHDFAGKQSKLLKARKRLLYLENRLRRVRMQHRREDTRDKIQLGGLVVKAGLREEDKAVILGILIKGLEEIQMSADAKENFRSIGDVAFKEPAND